MLVASMGAAMNHDVGGTTRGVVGVVVGRIVVATIMINKMISDRVDGWK